MMTMEKRYTITVSGRTFDYRTLMAIPLIILAVSVVILVNQYATTGEWFKRSIELKGGTHLNIQTPEEVSLPFVENALGNEFGSLSIHTLRGFGSDGVSIQMDSSVDYEKVLQRLENEGLEITDFSLENIGPSLSNVFWSQAQTAIIVAFILMGIIAFVVFRTFVPSIAIVMSAATDIIVTLSMMQVFGIEFSLASLGALLMLIGYSVDTDIMLTSRLLRESDHGATMDEKIRAAVKTGLAMTLTSIGAVSSLLFIPLPPALVQIASVLLIGLSIDILNTWLFNSVILRWYCESRGEA